MSIESVFMRNDGTKVIVEGTFANKYLHIDGKDTNLFNSFFVKLAI